MEYADKGDTVYLHFAANDTSGSGGNGASPNAVVRLCGAAASAAPITAAITASLLSNGGYPAGSHEVAIDTSNAAYLADNVYACFSTLAIDSENPSGFIGKFKLKGRARVNWENYFNNDDAVSPSEVSMVNNIQQKTANLPSDPAAESTVLGVNNNVTLENAQTRTLIGTPSGVDLVADVQNVKNQVWDEVRPQATAPPVIGTANIGQLLVWLAHIFKTRVDQTGTTQTVHNEANTAIGTAAISEPTAGTVRRDNYS